MLLWVLVLLVLFLLLMPMLSVAVVLTSFITWIVVVLGGLWGLTQAPRMANSLSSLVGLRLAFTCVVAAGMWGMGQHVPLNQPPWLFLGLAAVIAVPVLWNRNQ